MYGIVSSYSQRLLSEAEKKHKKGNYSSTYSVAHASCDAIISQPL